MLNDHIPEVTRRIQSSDVVLDIGGWAQPFRRADYVMDMNPYETRGFYEKLGLPAFQGEGPERFTRKTWIQRDICEKTPFPFADKSVDFVICSHTLEDIRDPLWVASEIIRIGKAGYIEVPSIRQELTAEPRTGLAGASHHRWLVEMTPGRIFFEMKYHRIHLAKNHFPSYYKSLMSPSQRVQYFFWQNTFEFAEAPMPFSDAEIDARLREMMKKYALAPRKLAILDAFARTELAPALKFLPGSLRECLLKKFRRTS